MRQRIALVDGQLARSDRLGKALAKQRHQIAIALDGVHPRAAVQQICRERPQARTVLKHGLFVVAAQFKHQARDHIQVVIWDGQTFSEAWSY